MVQYHAYGALDSYSGVCMARGSLRLVRDIFVFNKRRHGIFNSSFRSITDLRRVYFGAFRVFVTAFFRR